MKHLASENVILPRMDWDDAHVHAWTIRDLLLPAFLIFAPTLFPFSYRTQGVSAVVSLHSISFCLDERDSLGGT